MQSKLKAGSCEKNWDVGIFYSMKSEAFSLGTIFLLINLTQMSKKVIIARLKKRLQILRFLATLNRNGKDYNAYTTIYWKPSSFNPLLYFRRGDKF